MNAPLKSVHKRHMESCIGEVVPPELKAIPQWIGWKAGAVKSDGKFKKFPIGRSGEGTEWQLSHQWMTFEEALSFAESRRLAGVGLVLPAKTADGKHLVALDFDSVDLDSDPAENPRLQEIKELHSRLGSPYAEVSPSGQGIRMFVASENLLEQKGVLNPLGGKDELFCKSEKWVTVTGRAFGGSGIPDATNEIGLYAQRLSRLPRASSKSATPSKSRTPSARGTGPGWNGWPSRKLRDGDGREDTMLRYAGHLRAQGLPQPDIDRLCLEANVAQYEDPLSEDAVLDRARRYENPSDVHQQHSHEQILGRIDHTDAGNVALLHTLTGGSIRFVHELRVWIVWDGNKWAQDESRSSIYIYALRVAEVFAQRAAQLEKALNDPSTAQAELASLREGVKRNKNWSAHCRNRARIESMFALAQQDQRFVISSAELDRNPYLLGVGNGVVDLRTGILCENSKSDLILRRSPIVFNPSASMVSIEKIFAEITACPDGLENGKVKMRARPRLAEHLQKVLGYCLTGLGVEQLIFMLCGNGANGKSLLVDLLAEVMGDLCEVVPPEILLATKAGASAEQASPAARKLAGARCAITSESRDGARLDVAVVKRHTGDGKMTARGVYEKPITFDITHKIIFLTNHLPRMDHMDDAVRGRLQIIPFDARWNRPGATDPDPTLPAADKNLLAKLKAEAEGVLRFFVEGAVAYLRDGLKPPPEVTVFTQRSLSEQDTVRRWVAEECESCNPRDGSMAGVLHESYKAFCALEGEPLQAVTPADLGKRLKRLGYESRKSNTGAQYPIRPIYRGL
jgi:putative DNA primase/helicase